jgi:hypothetical protein
VTEPAITLVDPAIPHPAPVERGLIDRVSISWKDGQAVAAAIAERLPRRAFLVALDLIRAGVIADEGDYTNALSLLRLAEDLDSSSRPCWRRPC